jgi:hypothetical protein
MAVDASQIAYRDEFIAAFEQRQSLLRQAVTTDVQIKGESAYFLVAGSGSDQAVTRGVNGLIPAKADTETQNACTLVEWHDLRRKTSFNIFASQGDQRRIMQMNSMAVVNRKIDSDILAALASATLTTGAAATGSLALAMYAYTILGNNDVEDDGNIYAIISPAFRAYLMQTKEFASADYVKGSPMDGPAPRMFDWAGVRWIVSTRITGKGTASETCYMFHKSAMGHACNTTGLTTAIGYDEEQDYSFARTSVFMGSKLLQNTGIVKITHDGSAFAAV